MINAVVLTVDNIDEIARKSGKSRHLLVKWLIVYNSYGIYPMKVPLPHPPIWAGYT